MPSVNELVAELTSRDDSAAERAVVLLKEHGESAEAALQELLGSADAEHRWWAVRALAAMREPRTQWLLVALLDPESEVRAAAALALAAHPDQAAIRPLVTALSDKDGLVSVLAVNALVKIGAQAVPMLIEAFDGATAGGRIQILRTLAELRDPRAIHLMMNSLGTDSAALGYWAQEGLERLGLSMVYMKPE